MERSTGIWTSANIVTCVRVALVPAWLLCAELMGSGDGTALHLPSLAVALLFMALSLTDKLDGYLARSRGEVTTCLLYTSDAADEL